MICPYCGKSTRSQTLCEHCKKPTEFAARSIIRPDAIPGMEEPSFYPITKEPQTDKRIHTYNIWSCVVASAATAILATITSCLFFFFLSVHLQKPVESAPAAYQTESVQTDPLHQTEVPGWNCKIILNCNYPLQPDIPEQQLIINFGERIPNPSIIEGYCFRGWNTNPDGVGTTLLPNEHFLIPLSEDLILYGQWEKDSPVPEDTEIPDLNLWDLFTEPTESADNLEESEDSTLPEDTMNETIPETTEEMTVPMETETTETTVAEIDTLPIDDTESGEVL